MKSTTELQITQASLTWLFLCQLAILLVFVDILPLWLFPVLLFSAGWRYRILKGHWSYPGWKVKGFAVFLGVVGVIFSSLNPLSLEAATALLLLGFTLKNIELTQRRDGIVVVYIGYFLVATGFLYDQSLVSMFYAIILMVLLTASLISLHLSRSHSMKMIFALSSKMLLFCAPLMILGYLFFPRLPPLWSVPLPDNKATSGISDSMTPGDIADLAGSGALAFRAKFDSAPPSAVNRYWRGPVLSQFDGKTWNPSQSYIERKLFLPDRMIASNSPLLRPDFQRGDDVSSYSILYQPSYQNWAFNLTPSLSRRSNIKISYDYQAINPQKFTTPTRVEFNHYPDSVLQPVLPDWVREENLQLPTNLNPKTNQFVLQQQAKFATNQELILSILRWFQEQEFYYTLKPPLLKGTSSVDEFLFGSRRGFCAHYASSFAVMMRQAGIPARVVTGYQGGEWNEAGKFIAVHQFDAHAWTEVWLEGQGWIQLDPTAWVAPDRIEKGLRESMREEGSFLGDSIYYKMQFSLFNALRLKLDAFQFQWQRWVLNYDSGDQFALMTKLLGKIDYSKMLLFSGGIIAFLGIVWLALLGLLKPEDTSSTQYRQWQALRPLLKKHDVATSESTTPTQIILLIKKRSESWVPALVNYLHYVSETLYNGQVVNEKELKTKYKVLARQLKNHSG